MSRLKLSGKREIASASLQYPNLWFVAFWRALRFIVKSADFVWQYRWRGGGCGTEVMMMWGGYDGDEVLGVVMWRDWFVARL